MTEWLALRAARITIPRIVGVTLALVGGLLAFASVSLVAAQRGPDDPSGADSFQGCVNNHTGVLRIVTSGQQCAAHETPIQLGASAGDAALLERIEALEEQTGELEGEVATLQQENSDQQVEIASLQQEISDQQSEIVALAGRVEALENASIGLPACLTTEGVDGQDLDDIVFEGCNVHVRNGGGSTGTTNGVGNLIVGYNESIGTTRTGSHNLVVGSQNSYTSFGGIVAGDSNEITGEYASVTGGQGNIASGDYSSVSGGTFNTAENDWTSVTGGQFNEAIGLISSVSGGGGNAARGPLSTISGGGGNEATGDNSSVNGGLSNEAEGDFSSVGGGNLVTAFNDFQFLP